MDSIKVGYIRLTKKKKEKGENGDECRDTKFLCVSHTYAWNEGRGSALGLKGVPIQVGKPGMTLKVVNATCAETLHWRSFEQLHIKTIYKKT